MRRVRVIPVMMIKEGRAVVTRKFNSPVYVGDPINTIKIFNDKEVDELVILDITERSKRTQPDFDLIARLASESFMPLTYGGHVASVEDGARIISSGVEKICFNRGLVECPEVVKKLSGRFGKQSIVASIDVESNWIGKRIVRGDQVPALNKHLSNAIDLGVGEILLNSVDRDGSMKGYDTSLIKETCEQVRVPVVACGGAGEIDHFLSAIHAGASAAAAGAMFYFKGSFKAILVNYPDQQTLKERLYKKLG